MTKIKVIAIMLWMFFALLFSGCGKEVIYLPCGTPKPLKTELPSCASIKDDFNLSKCAATKYITLDGDYQALSEAFDSCK